MYAWVPGVIGDFRRDGDVVVDPGRMFEYKNTHYLGLSLQTHEFLVGSKIELGDVVYEPPRNGPTLWEIGIADRTAAEFYVPDPSPDFTNKLFLNGKEK